MQHGPEHFDAPTSERDNGLVVAFSFLAFAGIESAAVGASERSEGRLVEDPFESLVAAVGTFRSRLVHTPPLD